MAKTLKTVSIALLILLLSAAIGLTADRLKSGYDRAKHPLQYTEYVEKYADEYKVPYPICYAVIKTESGFNSAAVSPAGAIGLMQITPATFSYLCEKTGDEYESGMLYDPETNIRYGIFYLSMLYERFGVWETAFAAYNCGPTRVAEWIAEGRADEGGRLTEIPIAETAAYVVKVRKAIEKYQELYFTEE